MRFAHVLFICLALGVSSAVQAKPSPHEYCKDQAMAAGLLMKARQDGILMHDLMDALKAEKEQSILMIAEEAYRRPLAGSDSGKKVAVSEFQNEMYAVCIKATKQ